MRVRKSNILFALLFLGFFAFSNYFLGIFSFTDTQNTSSLGDIQTQPISSKQQKNTIPEANNIENIDMDADYLKLQQWKEEIKLQNNENKKIREELNRPRPRPPPPLKVQEAGGEVTEAKITKPVGKTKSKPPAKVHPVVPTPEHEGPQSECHYNRNRDYEENPIIISGRFEGRFEPCDIPCVGKSNNGQPDAAATNRGNPCVKTIYFTMENTAPGPGSYDIVANTDLRSDVPLPYFNWVEYNFKRQPKPKTATAQVAAFISNCGPQKRLAWMKAMIEAGVKIDSYGSCMHNTEIPGHYRAEFGADYNAIKMAVVSTYKFTMAFENSGTRDYVTEKLFGVLTAGSVPLYDGAPNGKMFGPSAKSMLFADDFETPEKMAKFILYLDSNDTAYEEYLEWKRIGPSDDFTALMDLGNVHSSCRLCIRTADMHRRELGQVTTVPASIINEDPPDAESIAILVRERGKFWMHTIYLVERTIAELHEKISRFIPSRENAYIYSVYEYWERENLVTDDDVSALANGAEVEVIYVVPEIWNR